MDDGELCQDIEDTDLVVKTNQNNQTTCFVGQGQSCSLTYQLHAISLSKWLYWRKRCWEDEELELRGTPLNYPCPWENAA